MLKARKPKELVPPSLALPFFSKYHTPKNLLYTRRVYKGTKISYPLQSSQTTPIFSAVCYVRYSSSAVV